MTNKENSNAFRLDISKLPQDCISIKSPIILTKKRFELLNKICDITGEPLRNYIEDALLQKVQIDLECPSQFGQAVCETLLKQWGNVRNDK